MTTASTQTLYAPNPPQFDQPLLKIVLTLVGIILIAALAVGS